VERPARNAALGRVSSLRHRESVLEFLQRLFELFDDRVLRDGRAVLAPLVRRTRTGTKRIGRAQRRWKRHSDRSLEASPRIDAKHRRWFDRCRHRHIVVTRPTSAGCCLVRRHRHRAFRRVGIFQRLVLESPGGVDIPSSDRFARASWLRPNAGFGGTADDSWRHQLDGERGQSRLLSLGCVKSCRI